MTPVTTPEEVDTARVVAAAWGSSAMVAATTSPVADRMTVSATTVAAASVAPAPVTATRQRRAGDEGERDRECDWPDHRPALSAKHDRFPGGWCYPRKMAPQSGQVVAA